MPELPEVETVRRVLEKKICGLKILSINVLWKKQVATDYQEFEKAMAKGFSFQSFERKGKFLIANLSPKSTLIFHLRMEGKLFVYNADTFSPNKFVRIVFYLSENKVLAFEDVRKFGKVWFYPEGKDLQCLNGLGEDANKISDSSYLLTRMAKYKKPLKEFLTDQHQIAGIGNIYADEICFATGLNPFLPAKTYADKETAEKILIAAKNILDTAISNSGSTIHSYKAAQDIEGGFQDFLKVYGREGKPCVNCHTTIRKRFLNGRGTSFCPKCQKISPVVGVTGGIASGKSHICQVFAENGYMYLPLDQMAKDIYEDEGVKKKLSEIDASILEKGLDKEKLKKRLTEEPKFRHRWLSVTYSALKDKVNTLINEYADRKVVIEAPLLFESRIDSLCTSIIMAVTKDPLEHLVARGDKNPQASLAFGSTNRWEKHLPDCDAIIETDSPLNNLPEKVKEAMSKLNL